MILQARALTLVLFLEGSLGAGLGQCSLSSSGIKLSLPAGPCVPSQPQAIQAHLKILYSFWPFRSLLKVLFWENIENILCFLWLDHHHS